MEKVALAALQFMQPLNSMAILRLLRAKHYLIGNYVRPRHAVDKEMLVTLNIPTRVYDQDSIAIPAWADDILHALRDMGVPKHLHLPLLELAFDGINLTLDDVENVLTLYALGT